MTKPKKQHYVPRFYLRNFKDNNHKNDLINCFNVKEKKAYKSLIKNVAQSKYFYESPKYYLESQLSDIEKESSKYINNLVRNKKYGYLNASSVRANLSYYLSLQFVRTKDKREWIKNNSLELKEELIQEIEIPSKFQDLFDELPNEEHVKDWHMENIVKLSKKFSKYFYYRKWILIKNKTKLNFWTSDNPILLWNPVNPPGLGQDNTFVFFPLSPKLYLCLADATKFSNLNQPVRNTSISSNISHATYFNLVDGIDIKKINYLQAKNCYLNVFSKDCDFNYLD